MAEIKKPNLKALREKDRQPVKGIFKNLETPGGQLKFSYKKYKEDGVETYTLEDGKIYTLPLGIAKHLNNNCWYPEHSYKMNDAGKPIARVEKKIKRCAFQSLEFMDVEENNEDIDIVTPL